MKNYRVTKSIQGFVIFLCWMLLFIAGMSISSKDYTPLVKNEADVHFDWLHFFVYSLTFTPTNAAMLGALSGLLGGIASNLTIENRARYIDFSKLDRESPEFKSFMYMTESPLASMLRGFVTFLILIAGSYLTNYTVPLYDGDASKLPEFSSASYFKFAVSVSLIAYLVGYDPTQLQGLIGNLSFYRKKPENKDQSSELIVMQKHITANGKNGQVVHEETTALKAQTESAKEEPQKVRRIPIKPKREPERPS